MINGTCCRKASPSIHVFVILGYGIFYANFLAHRDPDVFEKPEDFIPERWNGSNSSDQDKIFGFGSGPHRCIGENLMRDVMHFVGKISDIIQDPCQRGANEYNCTPQFLRKS